MGQQQDYYSVKEAAELLKCGENAVLRMVKRGELPARSHGKTVRFEKEDLESFLERCERTGCWPGDRR